MLTKSLRYVDDNESMWCRFVWPIWICLCGNFIWMKGLWVVV